MCLITLSLPASALGHGRHYHILPTERYFRYELTGCTRTSYHVRRDFRISVKLPRCCRDVSTCRVQLLPNFGIPCPEITPVLDYLSLLSQLFLISICYSTDSSLYHPGFGDKNAALRFSGLLGAVRM